MEQSDADKTLASMHFDGTLLKMTYEGDYGFDKYLESDIEDFPELLEFLSTNVTEGTMAIQNMEGAACSGFTSKTAEGDQLLCRNLDMPYDGTMLVETDPTDGFKSISITSPKFMGHVEGEKLEDMQKNKAYLAAPYWPMDGINEKGVAVAMLMIEKSPNLDQETGKGTLSIQAAIRLILDHADSAEKAIELLKEYDLKESGNYHLFISDTKGISYIVEYVNKEMVVTETTVVANHYITDTDYEVSDDSQTRWQALCDGRTAKNGITSEREALDILSTSEMSGYADFYTQWSVVYNMNDLTVDLCIQRDYDKVYSDTLK